MFVLITRGWWTARWCPGVVRLLTAGDAPISVPDAIVDEIKGRERGGLVELPRRDGLKAGDQVFWRVRSRGILDSMPACVRTSGC